MAELFAATYPERTSALVLMNATARASAAPGYEIGAPPEVQEGLVSMVEQTWGRGDMMAAINPSLAGDAAAVESWGRFFASPQARQRLRPSCACSSSSTFGGPADDQGPRSSSTAATIRSSPWSRDDTSRSTSKARPSSKCRAPTTGWRRRHRCRHRRGRGVPHGIPASSRHRPGPRHRAVHGHRRLHPRAVELGDARWRELLERHDELAATEVARFGGTISDFAGDGLLATFDGPARGVRCAFALRDRLRTLGLDMRAGLHTGEVERRRGGIAGIGVHIAARVNGLAGNGRGARVTDGEGPRYGLGPHVRRARHHAEGRSRPVGDPRSSRVTLAPQASQ